jgi:hypothetical protein
MTIQEEVAQIIPLVQRPPEYSLPRGATTDEIRAFSEQYNIHVPESLQQWLHLYNAPLIGPGGIYGVAPAPENLRIETHLDEHPIWKEKGWLPIAGDGTGNYYVLDTKTSRAATNPIYFLDHERDLDHPTYIVASDLWKFLLFLLKREIEWERTRTATWPFNKSQVLADDPALNEYQGIVSLPWES